MLLMGESINGTRKQVAEGIQARDAEFIRQLALDQVDAGAGVLDVNGGVAGGNEIDDLLWLIDVVLGSPTPSSWWTPPARRPCKPAWRPPSPTAARCRSSTPSAASSRASTRLSR